MRLILLLASAVLFTSCLIGKNEKNNFQNLIGKEDVVLILSDYNLDSIPKDVRLLTSAKRLRIASDSASLDGYTIYPPLSALGPTYGPGELSIKFLPKEITGLKNLQTLSLVGLGLEKLPEDFSNLENLEVLELSMNRLDISTELGKLKKLPKLKAIGLLGNQLDTLEIKNWEKERPDLQINYQFEFK